MIGQGLLLVGLLAAIPPPTITGGTKEQQERVRDAIKKVPACMQGAGKSLPVEIADTDEFGAFFNWQQNKMIINRGIMEKATQDAASAEYKAVACVSGLDVLNNLDRVVLHEMAHGWHHNGEGTDEFNETTLGRFLKIRYEKARDAWKNDKERQAIVDEYEKLQSEVVAAREEKKEPAAATVKRICELKDKLMARYKKLGLPFRFDGDMHAIDDDDGSEYIAMAVEMLVYDHKGFCDSYSKEEQVWLRDNMNACLRNLANTAPCFNSGEAVAADSKGGKWFRP